MFPSKAEEIMDVAVNDKTSIAIKIRMSNRMVSVGDLEFISKFFREFEVNYRIEALGEQTNALRKLFLLAQGNRSDRSSTIRNLILKIPSQLPIVEARTGSIEFTTLLSEVIFPASKFLVAAALRKVFGDAFGRSKTGQKITDILCKAPKDPREVVRKAVRKTITKREYRRTTIHEDGKLIVIEVEKNETEEFE